LVFLKTIRNFACMQRRDEVGWERVFTRFSHFYLDFLTVCVSPDVA